MLSGRPAGCMMLFGGFSLRRTKILGELFRQHVSLGVVVRDVLHQPFVLQNAQLVNEIRVVIVVVEELVALRPVGPAALHHHELASQRVGGEVLAHLS